MTAQEFVAPKRRAAGTVRVTLPAKVAYDPNALKESIAALVERLGCPECFSGAACLFETERDFVVNGPRELRLPQDPVPLRTALEAAPANRVTVGLASSVKYDLKKVYAAVDRVIDIIGPHPCISGFDTLFRDELIVINDKLQAGRL